LGEEETWMPHRIIKVEPNGVDWLVKLGAELRASFPDSAPAVSFACKLADQMGNDGRPPRILVRFGIPH
jgi:hypothetical protein